MKPLIPAVFMAATLTACAGAVPGNPQGYAGINHGNVTFHEDGKPKEITVYGGKENSTVSLTGKLPNGTEFAYSATDNKAFDGQRIRGAVERSVSQDVRDAFPGIVDSIVDALTGGL